MARSVLASDTPSIDRRTGRCREGNRKSTSRSTAADYLLEFGSRAKLNSSVSRAGSVKCESTLIIQPVRTSLDVPLTTSDPHEFCQTLFRYLSSTFRDRFSIKFGRATTIIRSIEEATLSPDGGSPASRPSVTFSPHPVEGSTSSPIRIPYDSLVIAAGPWSAQVCGQLGLPSIPITNLPGHSLLIRPSLDSYVPPDSADSRELPSGAVFAGIDGGVGGVHGDSFGLARGLSDEERDRGYTRAPEFFVRKNGQVYVAGENSIPSSAEASKVGLPNKLPSTVDEVKAMIDDECVGRLQRAAGACSPFLKEENGAVIEKTQVGLPSSS